MSTRTPKQTVVGLDIGTSKIAALVGTVNSAREIDIVGVGLSPSRGLRKGVIIDINSTVDSIRSAIQEAELVSGFKINSVCAGIAGSHIKSLNSQGIVSIREGEVSQRDIRRAVDAARTVKIDSGFRILHELPQEFIIDGQEGISHPIGMSGTRLEVWVHMVLGAQSAIQNIVKSVRRCGLEVEDLILEQLASSEAVLADYERELGVCIVDIGGGTSDIAVFTEGALRHTAVIPIAGDHVTNDIAAALHCPVETAEEIKKRYACCYEKSMEEGDEVIEEGRSGKSSQQRISRRDLAGIVEPRYAELLDLIQLELRRAGFEKSCSAGLVFTGGSSGVEGLVSLAAEIFQLPVRLGVPRSTQGVNEIVQSPSHSTGVGLLMYSLKRSHSNYRRTPWNDTKKSAWSRASSWFRNNF